MKRGAVIGLAVGAAVAVALAGAAVWWWLGSRSFTPEDTARAYLAALESGDYAAIDELRTTPLDDSIVADAFGGASAYISESRIEDVRAEGAAAVVTAEVELAGERRGLSFTLDLVDGAWVLSGDDLGALRATTALAGAPVGDSVWIGDALSPTGTDVAVLPAEYAVVAAPRGVLEGSTSAVVVSGEATAVDVEATLAPEATTAAQQQLDVYLDACTKPAAAVPAHCGLRVPWAADLSALDSIAFRIDERPALALSADASTFDATGGVVVATATGTPRGGGSGSFTYRADDWALRGSVKLTGDEMVLSVR